MRIWNRIRAFFDEPVQNWPVPPEPKIVARVDVKNGDWDRANVEMLAKPVPPKEFARFLHDATCPVEEMGIYSWEVVEEDIKAQDCAFLWGCGIRVDPDIFENKDNKGVDKPSPSF